MLKATLSHDAQGSDSAKYSYAAAAALFQVTHASRASRPAKKAKAAVTAAGNAKGTTISSDQRKSKAEAARASSKWKLDEFPKPSTNTIGPKVELLLFNIRRLHSQCLSLFEYWAQQQLCTGIGCNAICPSAPSYRIP